jgi:hypothetical protein
LEDVLDAVYDAKGGVMTYVVLAIVFVILLGALLMVRRRST